mgnify:FL=1
MNKILTLLILLLVLPIANAQLTIESFSSNPDRVLPGQQLRLSITLENVGDSKIENIVVRLDLSQVPFAPLTSSNENAIDEIRKNNRKSTSFSLVALPDAESKIYKIPVEISYNNTKKESLISLEINAKTNLDLILDNPEPLNINKIGKISLKFINNGLAQIKFLKVTLQESPSYEIHSK